MEIRSMFDKIFGAQKEPPHTTTYQSLNEYGASISGFYGSDLYDSDVVRTCVDVIAKNAAKLNAKHIRRAKGDVQTIQGNLSYLLQVRPNPYMSAYDMFYKVITQLYTENNAFIYIQRNHVGVPVGFYPISYSTLDMVEYSGELYCKFSFLAGKKITVPYADLVHLRRHFNRNDLYGEDSTSVFKPTLSLMKTIDNGLMNAIKSSAKLRGWLKFSQAVRPEDMKAALDDFVRDYLSFDNHGGIAAVDSKFDFVPQKIDPEIADDKQMSFVRENVYRFFGVNENIITANYTENQWNAFYESVIEPIAIQLSLEFTAKLFSGREIGHGNEIIFEANRLQYVSPATKVQIVRELAPLGLLTMNEGREIFNLSPVEGGEKRLVSLNFVNADKADEYQSVTEGEKTDE